MFDWSFIYDSSEHCLSVELKGEKGGGSLSHPKALDIMITSLFQFPWFSCQQKPVGENKLLLLNLYNLRRDLAYNQSLHQWLS